MKSRNMGLVVFGKGLLASAVMLLLVGEEDLRASSVVESHVQAAPHIVYRQPAAHAAHIEAVEHANSNVQGWDGAQPPQRTWVF